jgi:class 3 adenylate cyclase
MHCGHPVIASTPVDDSRFNRLAAAAPVLLAEKLQAASNLAGEQRVVTALLVDVVGSTALSEKMDVETWATIMNGAFDRIAPAIYRYEGTIARLLGDSVLAFFGAPVAHEDDPIRAVRAALDLIEISKDIAEDVRREHGVEFNLRACINTGSVVFGPTDERVLHKYTASGGAINLVSRIKFAAQPMTVLITENTYRFVEPVFNLADLGLIEVKGRTRRVRVYQVDGVKTTPGSVRGLAGLESPMVGRNRELDTLAQLCTTVRAGLGRAVVVIGEPGLGKTRLISEWKTMVEREGIDPAPRWVEGRCFSYGHRLAYHLLIEVIRSVIGVPDGADEVETRDALRVLTDNLFEEASLEVYPYLAHLLMLKLEGEAQEIVAALDPQALQPVYTMAIRRLLERLTAQCPMVLVLEDLHWADPSSIDLLIQLLPLATEAPILFCLVSRPERDSPGWRLVTAARDVLGGALTELTLSALSEEDSRQLVSNLLAIEALPESLRRMILKRSEGNPFFVEEVIRMLIDREAIIRVNDGWVAGERIDEVEIPDTLQGLLLARIDRLPEDVKRTLRVASVIGRQFPIPVLQQILGG